ncbi:Uncharacterised protein [Klebsiella pneumoniae]|nr:Uncharacterised protein [Klebsiella pneumoniae]
MKKGLTRKPGQSVTLSAAAVSRCARSLLAAACRCAAAVYRRAAAVLPVSLWLFAVVFALAYLRVGRFFHRRFTLMLARLFPAAAAGCRQQKAHDDIPSVITAESKANFFIAISFLQMYHRISSGKSEDKMEKSLFGPLCIPLRLFSLRRSSAGRNSRLMAGQRQYAASPERDQPQQTFRPGSNASVISLPGLNFAAEHVIAPAGVAKNDPE